MKVSQIDIAKRGHIAQAIRAAMERKQMKPADLHEKLGLSRKATTAYGWIAGRNSPTADYRKKVSKLLDIPEADLVERDLESPTSVTPIAFRAVPPTSAAALHTSRYKGATSDVLAFNVTSDGMARIRLDVTLPLETATPLFRMLLDAGVVMRQPAQEEA